MLTKVKFDLSKAFKQEAANDYFKILSDKKAFIELREIKLKRSLDANGLYWLWLTCLEKETGNLKDELHLLYRATYLTKSDEHIERILRPDLWRKLKKLIDEFHCFNGLNQIIDVIAESTTEQDTAQFSEYLKKIQIHARANMNVILLNQEDQHFAEFYKMYGFN